MGRCFSALVGRWLFSRVVELLESVLVKTLVDLEFKWLAGVGECKSTEVPEVSLSDPEYRFCLCSVEDKEDPDF